MCGIMQKKCRFADITIELGEELQIFGRDMTTLTD